MVSEPASNFEHTIDINQGTNQGVQVGMAGHHHGRPGRAHQEGVDQPSVGAADHRPDLLDGGEDLPGPDAGHDRADDGPAGRAAAARPARRRAGHHGRRPPLPPDHHRRAAAVTAAPPTTVSATATAACSRAPATGAPTVALIDIDASVQDGDPVVTSGIRESLFPADIPVGRVAEVKRHPGSLQLDVRVAAAADLAHLTFVEVVRYLPRRVIDRAA